MEPVKIETKTLFKEFLIFTTQPRVQHPCEIKTKSSLYTMINNPRGSIY